MKKLITIALLALLSTGARAQKELFQKYEDTKGVTTVVVSKAMLQLAGGIASVGGNEMAKMANRLDGVRILNCEDKSLVRRVKKDAEDIFKDEEWEEVMRVNDEGQRVVIYQRKLKGGKNEFSLMTEDKSELTIVNLTGNVSLEDMKGMAE